MDEQSKMLAQAPIGKLLAKLSLPAATAMVVQALYNIVDSIFVGQFVGVEALSGIAVSFPLSMFNMAVMQIVAVGASSILSRAMGERNIERAEYALGNAVTLSLVVGLFLSVFAIVFRTPILRLLGASDAVMPYASLYLVTTVSGTAMVMLGITGSALIRGEGNATLPMVSMIAGAIMNIILDAVFVIVFKWGLFGAAVATLFGQALTLIIIAPYYVRKKSVVRLHGKNLRLKKNILKEIVSVGASAGAQQFAGSVTVTIANNAIIGAGGGDIGLAVFSALFRMNSIVIMPMVGISQGMLPIAGFNYGAKQYRRVRYTIGFAIIAATVVAFLGFLLFMFFPEPLMRLFSNDAEFLALGSKAISYMNYALWVVGFQIIGSSIFQAFGKAAPALFLSMSRQLLFLIPALLILPRVLGLNGVWFSYPISDILAALVTGAFVIAQFKAFKKEERRLRAEGAIEERV